MLAKIALTIAIVAAIFAHTSSAGIVKMTAAQGYKDALRHIQLFGYGAASRKFTAINIYGFDRGGSDDRFVPTASGIEYWYEGWFVALQQIGKICQSEIEAIKFAAKHLRVSYEYAQLLMADPSKGLPAWNDIEFCEFVIMGTPWQRTIDVSCANRDYSHEADAFA